MKGKVFRFAKGMPRLSLIIGVIVSIIATAGLRFILTGIYNYIAMDSVTLSFLPYNLLQFFGHDRYDLLVELLQVVLLLISIVVFFLFLHIYCSLAMRRQYKRDLTKIMTKVNHISKGNFDAQFEPVFDEKLQALTKDIQNILDKLSASMIEERKTEQTKNELITNVSHDLRTPLTSVLGYLRYIEQDKYKDEVALRHYTGIAYEKSLQLESLINELFEYTRMQDTKFTLQMEAINLSEILGQLIIQNDHRFTEAGMICREHIPEQKMMVLGDGEKLARVFENLISNAIAYGKSGKYIDIKIEEIAGEIVVECINYGEPISPFDIPQLFERFYRADKSRAGHTGGSGLGLAISKSIIEHHQGKISVESNAEKTSFIVKLNKIES